MVSRSGERHTCDVPGGFARVSATVAVLIACAVAGGCASRPANSHQAGYGQAGYGQAGYGGYNRGAANVPGYWRQRDGEGAQVAGYAGGRAQPEMEDDGLPAQAAPRLRVKPPEPDDPTQPYSPNYGRVPPARSANAVSGAGAAGDSLSGPKHAGAVPADLPPAFRRQLADAAQ